MDRTNPYKGCEKKPCTCQTMERKPNYLYTLYHPKCPRYSKAYDEVILKQMELNMQFQPMEQGWAATKEQLEHYRGEVVRLQRYEHAVHQIRKGAQFLLPNQLTDICNGCIRTDDEKK